MNCDNRAKAVVELLGRLVACPSMNPGPLGTPGGGYGEGPLDDLLADLLHSWGAHTQRTELAPGRYNLVATWPGRTPGRSLLLDAHADTVGVAGMTIPPFEPHLRNGRLYGRGTCDTKGPMTAMLLAIRSILDEDGQLPVTVIFAATGDEEDGATGATRLVESGLRADAVIVGEPTELTLVHAHKGACRFRITLTGKAAHSSVPQLGINAVEAAADMIHLIRREFPARLQYPHHPELGDATVCVSTITGGIKANIVPERCQFEVDCRCLPGERREHLQSAMQEVLMQVAPHYPGLQVECAVFQWYPALSGSGSDPFVAQMTDACGQVTGIRVSATAPYATNGGFFSQASMPCVVFGPGSIAQAHTADEFIELSQVERAVEIYARMIRSFERPTGLRVSGF